MLNRTYKIFSILMVLFTSAVCSADESLKSKSEINKRFCSVAASAPMVKFENTVLAKVYTIISDKFLGNDIAAAEYQTLGKEAQVALGIEEQYHVPIKKLAPLLAAFPAVAFTMPGAIYVNEDRLKDQTYGAKRAVFFHEVVHRKYNDSTFGVLVEGGSVIGSGFLASELLSSLIRLPNLIHYPLVIMSALYGMHFASSKFVNYRERRADIEGHYATQCSVCVQESANRRRKMVETEKNPLQNDGYLFADALEKIAEDLKLENKLCSHHGGVN